MKNNFRPNLQDTHSLRDASKNLAGNNQRLFLAQVAAERNRVVQQKLSERNNAHMCS